MTDRTPVSAASSHDLAPLYALDALDPAEKIAFEEHLRQCDACAMDVKSFANVAGLVAETVSAAPPPELRQRLLTKVRRSAQAPGILLDQGGLLIARSEELPWQPLAPGIVFKALYQDSDRKFNTSLVRMDAGARYPSHRHALAEELFLLSGDLHVENEVMHSGDYCRGDSGSIHGETFTDNGCLFLLMASEDNRILEQPIH